VTSCNLLGRGNAAGEPGIAKYGQQWRIHCI